MLAWDPRKTRVPCRRAYPSTFTLCDDPRLGRQGPQYGTTINLEAGVHPVHVHLIAGSTWSHSISLGMKHKCQRGHGLLGRSGDVPPDSNPDTDRVGAQRDVESAKPRGSQQACEDTTCRACQLGRGSYKTPVTCDRQIKLNPQSDGFCG